MLHFLDPLREITFLTVILRLLFAFILGLLIGLERSYKNRPAGFRTHILVCVGSCVASLTGIYLYLNVGMNTDISRIGGQVVSGLGFIGAGTILVTKKLTVKGLTTAAGLWTTGIIGLAVGAGYYEGAFLAAALVLITETVFFRVSVGIHRSTKFQITLTYSHKAALDQVLRYFKDKRLTIANLRVNGTGDIEEGSYTAVITLYARRSVDPMTYLDQIQLMPGIQTAERTA